MDAAMTNSEKRLTRTGNLESTVRDKCEQTRAQQPKPKSHLFCSAKTTTPIPARHPALREALIQASLDREVHSITSTDLTQILPAAPTLDVVILQRDDGRFLLDVIPARGACASIDWPSALVPSANLELRLLLLTADDIRLEPRCANSRLVWSCRNAPIPLGLRMQALQTLLDDGPMTLGELLKSIRGRNDPLPSIMALACANLIYLDLVAKPLGPATKVGCCAVER
jgi:hypothetical protein